MSTRRDFIKFVVAGTIASGCPLELALLADPGAMRPQVDSENNKICHQIRDGSNFTLPPVSSRHDIVIAGGGVSGLTAGYLLKGKDVLLLEKEPHWGGNAYEMDYDGQTYATGAAFAESGVAFDFAKEIGLDSLRVDNWDGSIIKGEFVPDTWGDGLDHLPYSASVRESFKKFRKEMLAIDVKKRKRELDNVPFSKLMAGYAPELIRWWDAYGPSNWGSLPAETSAMVGVGDLQGIAAADRVDDRVTWPGGLGAISKRLVEKLQPELKDRMIAGATTIAVTPQGKEVHVTYMAGGQMKTVAAKGVIMATPKYITVRIVQGIPNEQAAAMKKIRYAPYPVVNLIYDKPVFNKGYDTWCPGNTFTDFIVADWTIRNQPGYKQKYNILTFYTPMREDDRGYLLTEDSTRKIAVKVLTDFRKLFPGSDVDPIEVHIYRRGHPMMMVTPGNSTEVLPVARRPMERIFFANTDSEGPVSTTSGAVTAARRAVRELETALAGKPQKTDEVAMAAGLRR